ncbi:Hsp20/alpha crystallin family protein [Candidatus Falkowbacteria bacterium]|jgi:HSP20 family protein|nr:Hsp20/alpha crystallin family protein [Patescibacteria group bacterium]MDD3435186.1 Hsp20/alpha crystallin family protein [Patescibacteria group bacterium]MDD4466712.1 Hsp20/alpha crystallin family protein [Patescibacteria group bacterium]NCU42939.1 Hsp20/alpha crystallin family protein [Candidatus Falkowbacteria bacterium]
MLNNLFNKPSQATIQENSRPAINDWSNDQSHDYQLAIDVYQTPSQIIIRAIVPGAEPEDLKISLHNDLLTIKYQKDDDQDIPEEDYFYRECFFGHCHRSLILPAEVDNREISANVENGILTITLKRLDYEQDQNQEIEIAY